MNRTIWNCVRSVTAKAVAYCVALEKSSVGLMVPIEGLGEAMLTVGVAGTELTSCPLTSNVSVAASVAVAVASEVGSVKTCQVSLAVLRM